MKEKLKEKAFAEKWCRQNIGYVPTVDEWMALSQEEPGLVKLFLNVFDSQAAVRSLKKELYTYEKRPTVKMISEDIALAKAWYGGGSKKNDKRSKDNV